MTSPVRYCDKSIKNLGQTWHTNSGSRIQYRSADTATFFFVDYLDDLQWKYHNVRLNQATRHAPHQHFSTDVLMCINGVKCCFVISSYRCFLHLPPSTTRPFRTISTCHYNFLFKIVFLATSAISHGVCGFTSLHVLLFVDFSQFCVKFWVQFMFPWHPLRYVFHKKKLKHQWHPVFNAIKW